MLPWENIKQLIIGMLAPPEEVLSPVCKEGIRIVFQVFFFSGFLTSDALFSNPPKRPRGRHGMSL